MIQPLGGFGGVGFSPGPLSISSPSLSPDIFGSFSLGASNFAGVNPILARGLESIAGGFGTGRSSYSPFGVSGMYGSIGLGAPMFGGGFFVGPGPNFMDVGSLFKQLWDVMFGPKQNTMPGGSVNASMPQPAADETGNADRAGKAGKSRKADKADEADGDKAEETKGADQAKGAAKGDWKSNAGKGFEGSGVKVAGTSDEGGKKVVRLEPETGFDPKKTGAKLPRALQTLHRNGVETAMIGDKSVPVGKTVRAAAKAKTELREATKAAQDAVTAAEAKPEDNDLKTKARSAVDRYNKAKRGVGSTWIPNTRDVLRALQKGAPKAPVATPPAAPPTADAGAGPAGGDVGAALAGPLKKVAAATYKIPDDKKSHRIVVKVDKTAKPDEVAQQMVVALDDAEKSMKGKAAGQQVSVAFSGDNAASAQKKFHELYSSHKNVNLGAVVSFVEVKKS